METSKAELVRKIWENSKDEIQGHLLQVRDGVTVALYNTQFRIQNLLTMAVDCNETRILEHLSEVFYSTFLDENGNPLSIWTNKGGSESILHSSQFLYAVAVAINAIVDIPVERRGKYMTKLTSKATHILDQYYRRWIFEKQPGFSSIDSACKGGASLRPTGGMTYSAWVRADNGDPNGWIVGIKDWTVLLRILDGKPWARVVTDNDTTDNDDIDIDNNSLNDLEGTNTLNDGAWHHVALVFRPGTPNASGQMQIYVDGVLDSQRNDIDGDVRSRGSRLYIGGYPLSPGDQHLRGAIDEVRLYSKALSSNEIGQLSDCADANSCSLDGIVARWDFENEGKDIVGYQALEELPTGDDPNNDGISQSFGKSAWFDGAADFAATHEWGENAHNHRWYLIGKLSGSLKDGPEDPDYCHAVRDQDMWIISGLTELLSAYKRDPNIFELPLEKPDRLRYSDYLELGLELIQNRISVANSHADFDVGAWDEHQDFEYSGYFGDSFPEDGDASPLPDISWDISHARRFVHVFRTLNDHRSVTGSRFPDQKILTSFANQYADSVFNGDFIYPSFSNYFNGTNGWYRVGFHGPHFGYGPSDLSSSAYTGGYGFWARYNPMIKDINNALWNLANSKDPSQIKHRKNTFGQVWNDNGQDEPEHQCLQSSDLCDERVNVNSLDMLMFLPVFSAH